MGSYDFFSSSLLFIQLSMIQVRLNMDLKHLVVLVFFKILYTYFLALSFVEVD